MLGPRLHRMRKQLTPPHQQDQEDQRRRRPPFEQVTDHHALELDCQKALQAADKHLTACFERVVGLGRRMEASSSASFHCKPNTVVAPHRLSPAHVASMEQRKRAAKATQTPKSGA